MLFLPLLALLMAVLVGCPRPLTVGVPAGSAMPALRGTLLGAESYTTQATSLAEIASGATVSLIDPTDGATIATSLTQPDGSFSLTFGAWKPSPEVPYLLEAVKGLSIGGDPNRPGANVARLRTLVMHSAGSWKSLTRMADGSDVVRINQSTTALCVISGLKALSTPQLLDLEHRVVITAGQPDAFIPTPEVAAGEYVSVWSLVDASLGLNQDPVRVVALDTTTGIYSRLERGPLVTDLSTLRGEPGTQLILYGNGFDLTASNNKVYFSGSTVPAPGVTVNASGTQLTVPVPANASTGVIIVQVGKIRSLVAGGSIFKPGAVLEAFAGFMTPPPGLPATGFAIDTSPYGQYGNDLNYQTSPVAWIPGGGFYFSNSFRKIFKVDAAGTIQHVAGSGMTPTLYNGTGISALIVNFNDIYGLETDSTGNLFVSDAHARIRMIPATSGNYFGQAMTAGNSYVIAGNGNGADVTEDALATSSPIARPGKLRLDDAGNLFFINPYGVRMIPRVSGNYYGKEMVANRVYKVVDLTGVRGIAMDGLGTLYVATSTDGASNSNRGSLRILDRATGTLTKITGWGSNAKADGSTLAAAGSLQFDSLSLDSNGNIFFGDIGTGKLWMIPAASGTYYGKAMIANQLYSLAGHPTTGGYNGEDLLLTAAQASTRFYQNMAVSPEGHLLFADGTNWRVRMVPYTSGTYYGQAMTAHRVYTVAGTGGRSFSGEGAPSLQAQLERPYQMSVDVHGHRYVSDSFNNRIRMVPATSGIYYGQAMIAGHIYTLATTAGSVVGIAAAPDGTIYFQNSGLKKMDPSGLVSAIATPGITSFATLKTDGLGNLYFASPNAHRVYMIPAMSGNYFGQAMTAGTPYAIAGNGTAGTSLGLAIGATMASPRYLAVDREGNVYIAWTGSQVRMLPARDGTYFGQAMTVGNLYALNISASSDADAQTQAAGLLAVDSQGNLYVNDHVTTLKRLSRNNQLTHFAGGGTGGLGTLARTANLAIGTNMSSPSGLEFGPDDTLYVIQPTRDRILKIY